jgi:RNA polymerase sigma-70 factor (ECF subfamily)
MPNAVQRSLPESAQFEARVCDLEDVEELMRVHRSRVLGHALWLVKDKDIAETVTQDCFMRAFNSRATYRGQCSVRTWLIKITTNLVRDRMRTGEFRFWRQVRASALEVSEMANRLACRRPTVDAEILAREKLSQIWAVVDGLPGRQRTIFKLRFVEEMQLSEIAQAMGLHEGTVKSHLYRSLHTIRAAMGKDGRSSGGTRLRQRAMAAESVGRKSGLTVLSESSDAI